MMQATTDYRQPNAGRVEAVEQMTGDWLAWVARFYGQRFADNVAWTWGTFVHLSLEEAGRIVARDHGYVIGDDEGLWDLAMRIDRQRRQEERAEQQEQFVLAHGLY